MHLDKKKEKSIKKMIETRESELPSACDELAKRKFFCEADAKKELEIFLAKHASPLFELKIEIKEEQVIKRRVRRNLAKESKPLTIPGKRKSFNPTGTMLLEMLKPLTIATIETDSGFIHQVSENQLTEDIRRLLHLAGFSEEIYSCTNYGRSPYANKLLLGAFFSHQ